MIAPTHSLMRFLKAEYSSLRLPNGSGISRERRGAIYQARRDAGAPFVGCIPLLAGTLGLTIDT
jgi:hypothetical protein